MGRPSHEPDDKLRGLVEGMARVGAPHDEICAAVGISKKTLYLHYRAELDTGLHMGNVKLRQSLYSKAVGNGPQAVTAAIFLHKVRLGMRETSAVELTGKDGDAIKHEHQVETVQQATDALTDIMCQIAAEKRVLQ